VGEGSELGYDRQVSSGSICLWGRPTHYWQVLEPDGEGFHGLAEEAQLVAMRARDLARKAVEAEPLKEAREKHGLILRGKEVESAVVAVILLNRWAMRRRFAESCRGERHLPRAM